MGQIGNVYQEVYTLVLSMWDEEPESIVEEVTSIFDISYDYAFELVEAAILEEKDLEKELFSESDSWEEEDLVSLGFDPDEDF